MPLPSSPSSDNHLNLLESKVLTSDFSGEDEVRISRFLNNRQSGWRVAFPLSWVLFAVSLGFLTMTATLCSRYRVKDSAPEALGRRLASGQADVDDDDSPSLSELEALCGVIGFWAPDDSFSAVFRRSSQTVESVSEELEGEEGREPTTSASAAGQPPTPFPGRWSPYIVEAFFKEIEIGEGLAAEQGAVAEAQSGPAFFLTESEKDSDEDQPEPSSQLPKRMHLAQAPPPPGQPSAQASAPAGLLPVNGDSAAPSTSTAPQAAPLALLPHPFIRLPSMEPGVTPRPWVQSFLTHKIPLSRSRHKWLLEIRELLLCPSLDAAGLSQLMKAAEELGNFAVFRLCPSTSPEKASDLIRDYGLRLILLHSLHSVARVVDPEKMPPWWMEVVNAMLGKYDFETLLPLPQSRHAPNVLVAQRLAFALLRYKSGSFPEDQEILELKRLLLCSRNTPPFFKDACWDPWRQDDSGS